MKELRTAGVFVQDVPELVVICVREIIPRDVFFKSGRRSSRPSTKTEAASGEEVTHVTLRLDKLKSVPSSSQLPTAWVR